MRSILCVTARAMDLLKRARGAGLFDDPELIDHLDRDHDLDTLRQRADFRAFQPDLRGKKPR